MTFSELIRRLTQEGMDSADVFDELWKLLQASLVFEMKKRDLWRSPPRYLGIYGVANWYEGDALEELTGDCMSFAVWRCLENLRHHLQVKSSIDGLVFRNIRNFLFERQRQNDKLGFKVFQNVQLATRHLIAARVIYVLEGDDSVRNSTVLGFSQAQSPDRVGAVDLRQRVAEWGNDLLPELVTKRVGNAETQARLIAHLSSLRDQEVTAFPFKSLVDALKEDIRRRWSAVEKHSISELGIEKRDGGIAHVPLVAPCADREDEEHLRKLVECMDEVVESFDGQDKKSHEYLQRLWGALKVHTSENGQGGGGTDRQLANRLRIPRKRLPGLRATLARLLEESQAILGRQRQ